MKGDHCPKDSSNQTPAEHGRYERYGSFGPSEIVPWKSQQQTILLADDEANDRFLIERALKKLNTGCVVHAVASGDEAIAFPKGIGAIQDRERYQFPGYVITDLKMPNGDGFDILNFLKHNPQLSIIPVVVFSASADGMTSARPMPSGRAVIWSKLRTRKGAGHNFANSTSLVLAKFQK
jgi:CheY-like chemotaxis protein